jgi:hypothetical protein
MIRFKVQPQIDIVAFNLFVRFSTPPPIPSNSLPTKQTVQTEIKVEVQFF